MRKLVVLMMLGAAFTAAASFACGDGAGSGKAPLTPDTEHNPNLDGAGDGGGAAPATSGTPAK